MRVAIRAGTRGCVTACVDDVGGRPVVIVEIDPADRKGALSSDDGTSIAIAAHTALAERIPFVGYIASSGADIVEGMAALHGWGLAARALADCSGIVPIVLVVTGPAVSGPALLLGLADLVVMTADCVRVRERADHGHRVHRRAHRHRRARRRSRARRATRAPLHSSSTTSASRPRWSSCSSPTSPPTPTRHRLGGRPTIHPTGPRPRQASSSRALRAGATTSAR